MAKYIRFPLTVEAIFTPQGEIKPKKIILNDGSFVIDRLIDAKRKCPQTVPSVAPIEYTVMVAGVEKKIYFEPHTRSWFSVKEVR
jgi:hypothetical protein